jgi:hypothetical protein
MYVTCTFFCIRRMDLRFHRWDQRWILYGLQHAERHGRVSAPKTTLYTQSYNEQIARYATPLAITPGRHPESGNAAIAKHMRRGRQEDAHEFLRYAIDALQKSCLAGFPPYVDLF